MAGNTFGTLFKITTYGESHGAGVGVIIDGCPPGIPLDAEYLSTECARRRPGQSDIVTPRNETDEVQITSGVFEGLSTGSPIHLFIPNTDHRSKDYSHLEQVFRPSHADYTYEKKFGIRDYRGGGRSSARETAARVAAGAVAKRFIQTLGIEIRAYVDQVGSIRCAPLPTRPSDEEIEANIVRCPQPDVAHQMMELIQTVKAEGDTIGGVIYCWIEGCPPGLGEPVFDKIHADLAKAMLSINAAKGFEIGKGFGAVEMRGSEHNDVFRREEDKIITTTNRSGGVQGGITNGMDMEFRVAFKPVSTLMKDQVSVDKEGSAVVVAGKGRHDPCVVPRAVPIVEAMAALVVADHVLRQAAIEHFKN